MDELKDTIKIVGLSNPIQVEKLENGFEPSQDYRRLSAFRLLADEKGDPRYSRIPAATATRGEPLVGLYRRMVDENLIRKDLSFGEMVRFALCYARNEGIDATEAVPSLHASA